VTAVTPVIKETTPVHHMTYPYGPLAFGELATAYRRYWSLQEDESIQAFQMAYREITRLEARAEPQVAWRILREAAIAHHAETGICPFCRERGPLHLPAEQPELELSGGQR